MLRLAICLLLLFASLLAGADISGQWTASFETAIGVQEYRYVFRVQGATLTGTAKSGTSESALQDGKIDGDIVTFVENRKFDDMEVRIEYQGKIVSGNEIRFTRVVTAFGATEELVAKRSQ